MQLPAHRPNDLAEASLICGVDVLISRLHLHTPSSPLKSCLCQPMYCMQQMRTCHIIEGMSPEARMPRSQFAWVTAHTSLVTEAWPEAQYRPERPDVRSPACISARASAVWQKQGRVMISLGRVADDQYPHCPHQHKKIDSRLQALQPWSEVSACVHILFCSC